MIYVLVHDPLCTSKQRLLAYEDTYNKVYMYIDTHYCVEQQAYKRHSEYLKKKITRSTT